jgi:hypothetical protein
LCLVRMRQQVDSPRSQAILRAVRHG